MMRLFIVAIFAFIFPVQSEEPFPIAKTVDFHMEEFEEPAQIWLPANYDPAEKWPVIFYYHGTNGKPTIEFLRLITGSNDWVLIGMGYKQRGTFDYTEGNLKAEIDLFQSMLAKVRSRISLDDSKIYVSGMSKGGWMTGLFLQKIPELAGGIIFGGGLIDAKAGEFDPMDRVFIGVGESDGNIAMSYGTRERLKKEGLDVTLDVWAGLGHQIPNAFDLDTCLKFRQWLKIQSGLASQEEAIDWFDGKMKSLLEKDKIPAFHDLISVSDMPFRTLLDQEATGALKDLQKAFSEDPDLKEEMAAWIGFQKAVTYEGKDRYVSTLAEALVKYQELTEAYPDTIFGKKSGASRDRVKMMLGME